MKGGFLIMENQITNSKKKQFNKKLLIPLFSVLAIGLIAAAVLIVTLPAHVTINEALSTTLVEVAVSGYPGETISYSIPIDNAANVPLNVELTFTETSPGGVFYSTNFPLTQTLQSGENEVVVNFTIESDSPVGVIEGNIAINRIA
jgi:hypothetical protein